MRPDNKNRKMSNLSEYEKPLILITCPGVSKTGKIRTQVAGFLAHKEPDLFEEHLHVKTVHP